jgi:hypothetical protein
MDLTAYLERQRKAKLVAAIKTAAKLIQDCPDPQKQWRAMAELRKLQARLNYPTL